MAADNPTNYVTWGRPAEKWTGSPWQWGRIYAFIWRYRDEFLDRFEKNPRQVVQEIAPHVGIQFDDASPFHCGPNAMDGFTGEQLAEIVTSGVGAYVLVKLCC